VAIKIGGLFGLAYALSLILGGVHRCLFRKEKAIMEA
jgi:hypothetical protein